MHRIMTFLFLFVMLLSNLLFAQQVLVDDAPMCGHHDSTTYQVLWNSLAVHGATVNFTTMTGRFPALATYDLVIVMHHNYCGFAGFNATQRGQLIDFVCNGGNLLIMPICWDDVAPHNDLLHDSRWMTGLTFGGCGGFVHSPNIAPFPPLTDGVDYLHFEITSLIYANPPAYPFVWDESGDQILAAVSYPYRLDGEDCDCHLGGTIIAIADNHTFETGVVGYTEPMDFLFMINTTSALAHIDEDTLENCFTPPGVPRLDSIPCADPGEIAHLYGENIPPEVGLLFDSAPISFTWHDSTHISFTVPSSAAQGYHTVTIDVDGRQYRIPIRVYCDWLDLLSFDPYCADIGDTVWFSGDNISLSASITFGGALLPLPSYNIISSTSGWFIVPDTSGLTGYPYIGGVAYRYQVCLENEPTQFDCANMLVPCPCQPDSDITVSIVNVRFWECTDGTDTVYIVYDLIADDPQDIVLYCSSDGGMTWDVPLSSITGAFGSGIVPGDSLVIVWVAGIDVSDVESSDWVFRLEAVGGELADSTAFINSFALMIGGTDWDDGRSIVQTSEGGFAVAGGTSSYGAGNKDLFLVKLSSIGDVEWARAVGGTSDDYGYSIVQTTDGGYAVVGGTASFGVGDTNIFLVKFDSTGAIEWSRSVGGTERDEGYSIVQATDGGYVVAGRTWSFGIGNANLFLVKFSSLGNMEWARTFGRTGWDYGYSIVQTTDGGYAIAGYTYSSGSGDILLVKVSDIGALEWHRVIDWIYGGIIVGRSIIQTSDNGFAVTGNRDAADLFLAKFTGTGSLEWIRTAGGAYSDEGYSVVQTTDGNLVVSGSYCHGSNIFPIKFSVAGSMEWARSITFGASYDDNGRSIIQTSDGHLVIAGDTRNIFMDPTTTDLVVVKLDGEGNCCIGEDVSPFVRDVMDSVTVISPSITVLNPSPTVADITPTITNVTPTVTTSCIEIDTLICPYGGIYAFVESDPGPVDTYEPRVSAICPPGGDVGDPAIISWSVTDSFIPPETFGPSYPIEIFYSPDGGTSWSLIGVSDNSTSAYNWHYPGDLTSSGMIAICATDSFGHIACDTCGTFSITGDTISPWGYAYADTCSPDSVFLILHDDTGIDWSTVCIQDPVGVLCYPDSMRTVGDTMLVFYPRLPDSLWEPGRLFYVRLSYAADLSGNSVHEMLVVDSLTPFMRHPCCYPIIAWLECPQEGWIGGAGCADQTVTFGICDTTGQGIDTTRIFVRQIIDGSPSILPPSSLDLSYSGDTIWVMIPGSYSEMDSVWIIMDSLFTVPGCKTEP